MGEERYRPLPTGTHGLDPEAVKDDQRRRLRTAMIELIAKKGYPAVRIADLTRLARVSQPTLYSLYAEKEDLLLSAYDEVAALTAGTVISAYREVKGSPRERLRSSMGAFFALAAEQPDAVSLQLLGAFGAGAKAIERRQRSMESLERAVSDAGGGEFAEPGRGDHTVMFILGGMREVTATRLLEGRESELAGIADELTAWTFRYPRRVPPGLEAPAARRRRYHGVSERARRAEGRLRSGRTGLSRKTIEKSQRGRIVDATAAIVAEKGLDHLTVSEIARRANVSHATFYDNYSSKQDAFVGAQKVGMHQALQVTAAAYGALGDDWPGAVAAGMGALAAYLSSEPAHAHLSLVDTFGASPDTIAIRSEAIRAFAAYLEPGFARPVAHGLGPLSAEAVAGGVWQVLHHHIARGGVDELARVAPQLTYLALTPFVGPELAGRSAAASMGGTPGTRAPRRRGSKAPGRRLS